MKKSPYEHGRQVFGPTAELNFKMGLSNFFAVQLWIWTAINYCFVGCPVLFIRYASFASLPKRIIPSERLCSRPETVPIPGKLLAQKWGLVF